MLFNRSTFIPFAFIALLSTFSVHAGDDDYLKMLEDEASDLKIDKSNQLSNEEKTRENPQVKRPAWNQKRKSSLNTIPPSLTQNKFEKLLEEHFNNAYISYKNLSEDAQDTIYHNYKKGKSEDIDSIRKDILQQIANKK